MTGYGKAVSSSEKTPQWAVECTSVNRKQLEVQLVAPRALGLLETELRRCVGERFHRGRITVSIQEAAGTSIPDTAALICRKTARAAAADLRDLQADLGLAGEISLELILRHPLFSVNEPPAADGGETWGEIWSVVEEALGALDAMRRREGAELQNELTRLHGELQRVIGKIAELAPAVPLRHRENLLARIERANLEKLPDEGRLATEVALFADRCDITEELARLESHLLQFHETLGTEGAIGRTLEFIVQELFREINTTGSKASDPQISRLVVEAKTLLDQIREQLANVE